MKLFIFFIIFLLSGCSNYSENNYNKKINPENYLLTLDDLNQSFTIFNETAENQVDQSIVYDTADSESLNNPSFIIDKAIYKLSECANNDVIFYSDAKAQYEGKTLVGELYGGADKVYAEINSYVYVKRGIEKEFERFAKYRNCYGDYITARFKASLDKNITVSDYSSEVIDKDKIRIIHYRFDISNGEKIFAITNSLFISKEYSLISVAEVITIGGDATEEEYNNIINKILN